MTTPLGAHNITTIAFDADDTLWHNETIFRLTEERFAELLSAEMESEVLMDKLLETERKNLKFYGYGIKGFTLSMIETAIQVTEGRASSKLIAEIMAAGREMLTHPVETLPGVRETIEKLSQKYRVMVITKGDLFDQERKVAESGIAELFHAVEIVSEKTASTYEKLFQQHGTGAEEALMVGNSMKSDILPALEVGAWAVHIPYQITWALEHAPAPLEHPRFREVKEISEVAQLFLGDQSTSSPS